jgi:hypothetical protein
MVITTVVKTHNRYWVSNPKQLADSILHWEEKKLPISTTRARLLYYIIKYCILVVKARAGIDSCGGIWTKEVVVRCGGILKISQ